VLVPIGESGLLLIRRGYEGFGGGKLALPGGFMEYGESWQEAAAREVLEETNVPIQPSGISLITAMSVQDGKRLVLACLSAPFLDPLPPFSPGTEILERVVITAPVPLAYSSHLQLVERFFQRNLPTFSSL
jgi:ADP-ribose pyrophosphatase YjhB (NUDIX family)